MAEPSTMFDTDACAVGQEHAPFHGRCVSLLAAVLVVCACGPGVPSPPRVLQHKLTRPANSDGVFLNEELVFYFSAEVDRTSVTSDSVRIVASDGRNARGRLSVEGRRVRFVPDPVLASDLGDGGYRPDTQYAVEILGFPNPDGVRGARGEPLEGSYRWSFHTVRVTMPRSGLVFDDPLPDRQAGLRLFPSPPGGQEAGIVLVPRDPIYLASDKPLDPSSVHDEDFDLRPVASSGARIGVRARLIENEAESSLRARQPAVRSNALVDNWKRDIRAALIELTPKQNLSTGEYRLRIRPSREDLAFSLRDFSGRPVLESRLPYFPVRVTDELSDATRGVLHEAFLDTQLRSPVAVPGYDGTALWSDTGRIEVRYPMAAGDGSNGAVELGADESRGDVQATRIDLPAGQAAALATRPGLVVLRCQGRMAIEGQLTRAAPLREKMAFEGSNTLSEWLAVARRNDSTWTVLIAGGDLVIDGELRVSTPLLLCAGGVIRVSGNVVAAPGQLYMLGDGGGLSIDPAERAKAPLAIDCPVRVNPLVKPLRLAVLSGPIPPHGEVLRWLAEEVRGSSTSRGAHTGTWSVRYVAELTGAAVGADRLVPVESPRLFDQPGSLQLLITLDVEPGGLWDPPFVDYVRLSWEQPGAERGAR